ncbi:hypothetical protein D3C75_1131100 [compost metagenome]
MQQQRAHLGLGDGRHFLNQRNLPLRLVKVFFQRPPYCRCRHGNGEQLLGYGVVQFPGQALPFLHNCGYTGLLGKLGIVGGEPLQGVHLVLPFAADPAKLLT